MDDDPLELEATTDMLRDLGHDPTGVLSAKAALELLETGKLPDLVILDYAMPEMTGLALAHRIHEIRP